MSTNFPGSLDAYARPTATDNMDTISHAGVHDNAYDAIEALEAKVGVTSSAVNTTHDYKLSSVATGQKAVSTSGDQTVAGKKTFSPTGTFNVHTGEYPIGNSGTSKAVDWSNGDRQSVTLTGNCTFTYSNAVAGQTLTLRIIEDGTGGRTVTLPTSKWPNGVAGIFTTTANAINLLIVYYDGTNYLSQLAPGFA